MSQPQAAPARLRALASWQAGRVATLGARLTAAHMALEARSDFAVLAALDELGPLSQAEIGRSLGLDRANVNRIATRLEQEGLIARTQDPDDGRRQVLTATPAGTARLAGLERSARRVQDELLAALDVDEREQLRLLLDKVLAAHPAQPA
ncbi:MarR family winged helix-turn-helix transcriptional regulator [Microlunatus flavus]|uniref:DNA-binding transcriptional regulator, MarR family n=1 Tax=Microlunatus flavus TaxID=1036181 RepID=A0A1H8ZMD6_9ACTN|nr:MarR family transcriptional regulator [Microlunatus flavus]SEP65570.1 DNA-binding transcriptional regulator, MarR family [Microlunatus flavus]